MTVTELRVHHNGPGTECSVAELRAIFEKTTKAPVTLVVRNFNNPDRILRVEVDGKFALRCDLCSIFPELEEWVADSLVHESIRALKFFQDGDTIAKLIKRNVCVHHLYGSEGDEDIKKYGPFYPQ